MALKDLLKTHRTWEDGVGLTLGLMIGLSPWFYDEPVVPVVVLNSGLTGLAVLALAQLELVHLRRWEEIAQLACGLWLSASPFIFHSAHQDHLRLWHWALGSVVSILAVFELWQGWSRDLRRKGHYLKTPERDSVEFDVHPNQVRLPPGRRSWAPDVFEGVSGTASAAATVDVKALHAKIGELTLENDFLEGAFTEAGLLSARR
jgi:hypothetical protein